MLNFINTAQIEATRRQAAEDGHDAKRAGCFISNPHMPGSALYEAYRDGYDLGVLTAKIDMEAEEGNIVKLSDFKVQNSAPRG